MHHGNTEKLVKRIAEECQVDLIDAVKQPDADLSSYDMIGFASGIYFSKFHQSILEFAEKNLPDDKKIFLICTYGGSANYKTIEQILDKRHASVVGKFGCKGYDTFGPFKLVGGIAKDHPNEEDMKNAADFRKKIRNTVFLLRSFTHCWMNDIRNGKSRGQSRRCMMHTWKASVHWMKSLT